LEQYEIGIFEVLAPLYFPRNHLEETSALWQLPKNVSGISGELSISDRQIRITRNPQHNIMMLGSELTISFSGCADNSEEMINLERRDKRAS
jgi:hypothetical protein